METPVTFNPRDQRRVAEHLSGSPETHTFDFQPRTRVIFGAGTLSRLGEVAVETGPGRVLLVTDHGLAEAGHADRAVGILRSAGADVVVFDDVHPNPTTADVERGLAVARDAEISMLVGLGGGSSMDCAKGINFLLTNGGRMEDYRGIGKASQPMLPMIAVPTTSGTGSEAQSYALIASADTHVKMACGDPKAACRSAILDPELTLSMPSAVSAATGIDAISHAVETWVTRPRNPISSMFSRRAWQLLSSSFRTVLDEPNNPDARGRMLLGAHFAGAAIENSMLGAAHALANPLTARFDITHGIAVGIMLPHVVRFNSSVAGDLYAELATDIDPHPYQGSSTPAECVAEFIRELIAHSGSPTGLAECDVDESSIADLARDAAQQWTGTFNPRPVDAESLEELYRCAC